MPVKSVFAAALVAALSAACLPSATFAQGSAPVAADVASAPVADAPSSADQTLLARGRYLATAADCAACHTAQGGKPFAGGYPINSPMGTIYSTNITPSTHGGIGDYSEADFSNALRRGVRRDGQHLYPAMPYTSYALLSDADVHALYTWFREAVAPVDATPPQTALPFPFSVRASMKVWNALFLDTKPFEADPQRSPLINHGAYLANALAHCAACHTPRNAFMGEDSAHAFAGGSLGSWYAPNISSDPVSGIGGWSDAELVQYLKTGSVPGKAQAAGPMAEAIDHSLQYLSDDDLSAIAAYLKQTKPMRDSETQPRFAYGTPMSEAALRGNEATPPRGWQIFSGSCAACHQVDGGGLHNHDYPSLYHNTATGAADPSNLISVILFGLQRDAHGKPAFMPAFGPSASFTDRLSDQDVADVANYVLHQFGNPDVRVSDKDVAAVREGGKPPALALLGRFALPGLVALALVIVVVIVLVARTTRARRKTRGKPHGATP
ncbi:c-type cytochrome [Paraburkholderia sp. Ac-20347]|jgi:fructose 5-dehydrogenase cytochrome subunit|uniref:c-type cytochrome n=1 Tax=Paraburkholderia sp. Ac-20347 TaxID=2703892 RepID=UPI001F124768|nr:c-type cytochrome [Paraburkholderia sp. Ac-20347]